MRFVHVDGRVTCTDRMRSVVIIESCMRVCIVIINVTVEFAVRVPVCRMPTRQELRVDVVRPLREQRPGACSVERITNQANYVVVKIHQQLWGKVFELNVNKAMLK